MTHRIWQNRRNPGDAFLRQPITGAMPASFVSGDMRNDLPDHLTIVQNAASQGRLTDNVMLTGRLRVFSSRLVQLLRDHGVDNMQLVPCSIENAVTGETRRDFFGVNVVGKCDCIDLTASDVEPLGDGSDYIIAWGHLTLRPERIRDLPFFVLSAMPGQIIVAQRIARALEEAGITGVSFVSQGDTGFDASLEAL